jgi:single-stranded-DNA-specific exonuclease
MPEPVDASAVAALETELRLPEVVCRLLYARGFRAVDNAKTFLRPRFARLDANGALLGLDDAVDRLVRAAQNGETVLIHGDYDVDGICSTTILTKTLRHLGARAVPFIPHRLTDGYDLTAAGVTAAIRERASVVVTCDCGTSALAPIRALCEGGIDVIVTDHHLPGGPLPECLAVLNPRRPGCSYGDKDLAAVGVVFHLALALIRKLGGNENFVYHMLDLVALATVADIAPLRGENRVLVRYGLKLMAESSNPGIRALLRATGLEGRTLTGGRVGFVLAPRLNAVGRLGHALRGVELLMCENDADANPIARELEELNRQRQDLDRLTLDMAREHIARIDLDDTYGIVLADERWHPGVIGIVASRVVEEFARPTVLIALKDGEGKGSGRSISAFDLHGGLSACREHLLRFGGHRAAAGVTIAADNVERFAARFNEVAHDRLTADDLVPQLRADLEVPIEHATLDMEALLRHFEPCGMGNPAPVLVSQRVALMAPPRILSKEGLKLRLKTESGEVEAIGWGMAERAKELEGMPRIDVAYRLERDHYMGETRLVLRLLDFRATDAVP